MILVRKAQSVFFPNPERTVVSDNFSLAGRRFSERQLKPFSFVKQLDWFHYYRLRSGRNTKMMFYRMGRIDSSENNFEFNRAFLLDVDVFLSF